MRVNVSTSKYEWAHGRKPRGVGYWAFFFGGKKFETFWHFGSYTEAKVAAVAEAKRKKVATMEVGS